MYIVAGVVGARFRDGVRLGLLFAHVPDQAAHAIGELCNLAVTVNIKLDFVVPR